MGISVEGSGLGVWVGVLAGLERKVGRKVRRKVRIEKVEKKGAPFPRGEEELSAIDLHLHHLPSRI